MTHVEIDQRFKNRTIGILDFRMLLSILYFLYREIQRLKKELSRRHR